METSKQCPTNIYYHSYMNPFFMHYSVTRSTAEGATDDVSSTDDYSCSTCSYTGDSGFLIDSQEFQRPLQLPPSLSQPAHHQREQGLDINSSALYASLITTDVQTGYYKSLNAESRISGRHFLIGVIHYSIL